MKSSFLFKIMAIGAPCCIVFAQIGNAAPTPLAANPAIAVGEVCPYTGSLANSIMLNKSIQQLESMSLGNSVNIQDATWLPTGAWYQSLNCQMINSMETGGIQGPATELFIVRCTPQKGQPSDPSPPKSFCFLAAQGGGQNFGQPCVYDCSDMDSLYGVYSEVPSSVLQTEASTSD